MLEPLRTDPSSTWDSPRPRTRCEEGWLSRQQLPAPPPNTCVPLPSGQMVQSARAARLPRSQACGDQPSSHCAPVCSRPRIPTRASLRAQPKDDASQGAPSLPRIVRPPECRRTAPPASAPTSPLNCERERQKPPAFLVEKLKLGEIRWLAKEYTRLKRWKQTETQVSSSPLFV